MHRRRLHDRWALRQHGVTPVQRAWTLEGACAPDRVRLAEFSAAAWAERDETAGQLCCQALIERQVRVARAYPRFLAICRGEA